MSDLASRNAEAMKDALRRQQAKVEELIGMVRDQNKKISTLDSKVAALEREVVLTRISSAGHGSTS